MSGRRRGVFELSREVEEKDKLEMERKQGRNEGETVSDIM
jgi:hypothetical protein